LRKGKATKQHDADTPYGGDVWRNMERRFVGSVNG